MKIEEKRPCYFLLEPYCAGNEARKKIKNHSRSGQTKRIQKKAARLRSWGDRSAPISVKKKTYRGSAGPARHTSRMSKKKKLDLGGESQSIREGAQTGATRETGTSQSHTA